MYGRSKRCFKLAAVRVMKELNHMCARHFWTFLNMVFTKTMMQFVATHRVCGGWDGRFTCRRYWLRKKRRKQMRILWITRINAALTSAKAIMCIRTSDAWSDIRSFAIAWISLVRQEGPPVSIPGRGFQRAWISLQPAHLRLDSCKRAPSSELTCRPTVPFLSVFCSIDLSTNE